MGKMGKWIVETLMYQWFVYFPLCVDVGENGRENGKMGYATHDLCIKYGANGNNKLFIINRLVICT